MFRNIISTFFTRSFIAVSNFLVAVLLSNYLGSAGRGEQSLIITLIAFIIIITGLIGTSSISYLIPRIPFSLLIIPSYLWVMAVTTLCFVVLPYLDLVPAQYMVDVCFISLLLGVLNINISVLISHQKINAANFLNFVQALIILLLLVVFFVFLKNESIRSYLLALYAGYGITLLLSFYWIRSYFRDFRFEFGKTAIEAIKKLAILGLYNQIAVFTQLLSFRLSYYLLNATIGKEEVGVYANAVSIAESVWLFGRSIGTVQHARIVNSKDNNYSLALTSRLNKTNLLISLILISVLACIPESWYRVLFGDEFININRIIWTMGPGIVFFGVALILGYYFSSTGKHFVNAIASFAGLIITVTLGFSIIPSMGSYGAGITASVSYGMTALVVVFFFIREKRQGLIQ
ncbi:MAG: oligosaccharide flippase family protein [Bacteroidales bacterium]|nr:oligosaccharide flippase family protein [Bacteroidales bacterium]